MKIEKKGLIWGAIWGLISLVYAMTTDYIKSIYVINPILLKLSEYTIYLPANIVSTFEQLIFGEATGKLIIIILPIYYIGTILMGAYLGYLISKIIKRVLS